MEDKKSKQLGMSHGTASNRLKKQILFSLVQETKKDICFQCGEKIKSVKEFSIEHKVPWLDKDTDLFWDLDNIAFSHLSCNVGAGRKILKGIHKHPSISAYNDRGCRCDDCKKIASDRLKRIRGKKKML